MKKALLITIIVMLMSINEGHSQHLSDYKWKNRVLILSDTKGTGRNLKSVYKLVKAQEDAWKERDVILLFLMDKELSTSKGQSINYSKLLPEKFKGYILIGKDGGIKMKEHYPLEPEKVFERIDGMPM